MNFINPLGFLALLGVPLILLMYILKQKFKKEEVSSMILWQKVLQQSEGHKWRQKLRKNILMFLQIAAVIFAALAIAQPFISASGERLNYIFVADTSFSMAAADETPTRLEKAKEDILNIIEQSPEGTMFSVINLSQNPEITINRTSEKQLAENGVMNLNQTFAGRDTEALVPLLKALQSEDEANVFIFTDKNIDEQIDGVSVKIYGGNGNNYAVKLVSENSGNVLVTVDNYGQSVGSVPVALFGDGIIIDTKDVYFEGSGSKDIVFAIDEMSAVNITAKIITEDILEEDNSFTYVNNGSENAVKVLLVTEGNIFAEKALSLISGVDLYKRSTDGIESLSGYDVYVFDGVLPEKFPSDGNIIVFNPPEGGIVEAGEEVEISKVTVNSNIFSENAENLDFAVGSSRSLITPLWAETVMSGENAVIAYAGENNNIKTCVFGFDLHNSELPLKKEFPIIMYNIMNYMAPGLGADGGVAIAGSGIELNLLPKTIKAEVIYPSGKTETLSVGETMFDGTDEIGIYTVREFFEDEETAEKYFAVNPVTTGESEMEQGVDVDSGENAAATVRTGRSLKGIGVILMLIVLAAEWWVNWRGN